MRFITLVASAILVSEQGVQAINWKRVKTEFTMQTEMVSRTTLIKPLPNSMISMIQQFTDGSRISKTLITEICQDTPLWNSILQRLLLNITEAISRKTTG